MFVNNAGSVKSAATKTIPAEVASRGSASAEVSIFLPDQPLVTIQPSGVWSALNLRDIWHYRELLYFLTWRDVKVRYKQTILGVAWVVMQPLASTLVFTVFLGRFARVPSDGIPYALLVFTGLVPWTFFSGALTASGNSLVASSHLITKVYFPRMIVPAAAVGARLLDFLISFAVLIGLMLYYGTSFSPRMLWVLPLTALITLLSLAVGMWSSAMNVKYRDVGVALPTLIMLWMFASPVVYSSTIVYAQSTNPTWRFVYSLNPLVGIIDNFRAALLGFPFNFPALASSVVITLIVIVYAAYDFKRMERAFADII